MENQHRAITGYRELSEDEIALMNEVKALGTEIEATVTLLKGHPGLDQRWVAIGVTNLQQGLMALVRGIAQPTTF